MKFKIKTAEIQTLVSGEALEFPKYSTQIMNLANSNAQGTRPAVVGQMSDLIQEFPGKTLNEWEEWYKEKNPEAIRNAAEKIFKMVENFQAVINEIDKEMVQKWVEDLVITKTFIGLRFQEAILKKIAEREGKEYRLAEPYEESKGVDGYVGDTPISIKPITYKHKNTSEDIGFDIVFYDKKKDGINVEYDF